MPKDTVIKTRVEPALKAEVEGVLRGLGLSTSDAIALFLYQVRLHRGLPFDVKLPMDAKIPNETTLRTFMDTDAGKNLIEYDTLDDMFEDLLK